jgi:hypothetical protein
MHLLLLLLAVQLLLIAEDFVAAARAAAATAILLLLLPVPALRVLSDLWVLELNEGKALAHAIRAFGHEDAT